MTTIKLQNISKVYGSAGSRVAAVDDVTLQVDSGEFFFLLGPSGCGKTTLLRIIAGLVVPSAGRVLFNDRDVTDLGVDKRSAAMVFQNYALWPHMTVEKNVEFGPKMKGLARRERLRLAMGCLERVQMEDFARRKPSQLSGGQQQRVALARAMAAQGECLLLDEPLSNLDARLRLHMRGQLRQLVKSTGATALYVTHDQKEALSMADRIAVMDAGKIVQVGPPQELYSRPATRFVADFLGEANFATGVVVRGGSVGRIQSPVGDVLAAGPSLPAEGTSVTVCIRPENLLMAAASDAAGESNGLTRIAASVVSRTYLGELTQYVCRLSDGTMWRISKLADGSAPLAEGQTVTLQARPEQVVVLTQ